MKGTTAPEEQTPCIGKTHSGKWTELMVLVKGQPIPLGVHLSPANINEVALAETILAQVAATSVGAGWWRQNAARGMADRSYDSIEL